MPVMQIPSIRRLALFGLALLLVASSASSAPADTPHAQLNGFIRTGKYALMQGQRRVAGAEVYHSRRSAAFLVLHSGFAKPLLLRPRTQSIECTRPEDIIANSDGSRAVKADAKIKKLGRLRRSRSTIQITIPGYSAALVPNPPLLGWITRETMVNHTPEYQQSAERFRLDPAAIKALARPNEPVEVYVYFGSWCHTCSTLMGGIIRAAQELEGSGITFLFYGLPKPPAMYRDPQVKERGIKKLPTGLVYSGNRLLGQIVSTTWQRPTKALRQVLGR